MSLFSTQPRTSTPRDRASSSNSLVVNRSSGFFKPSSSFWLPTSSALAGWVSGPSAAGGAGSTTGSATGSTTGRALTEGAMGSAMGAGAEGPSELVCLEGVTCTSASSRSSKSNMPPSRSLELAP